MNTKILFIVTKPETLGFYRGCLNYLRQRGFELYLCSSPGNFIRETAEKEGAKYAEIPMKRGISPISDIFAIRNLCRYIRKVKPAIVVSASTKTAVLGTIAAKLCGVPIRVFVKWGIITEGRPPIVREIFWLADKLAALCATSLSSDSESVTNCLVETKIAKGKNVYLMEHYVFSQGEAGTNYIRTFAPSVKPLREALELRKKYGIPPRALVIGNIGRLTRFKGILELIEAYKRVLEKKPDTRLLVVGPHDAIDAVPEALDWLQKQPQVILAGSQWNLAPYYSLMDLFVFPSHREGFGVVAIEAGSMGLPTAGFSVTGVVDSVKNGYSGTLVQPKNSNDLADAIVDYLDNPQKRFEHGINARRYAVEEFLPEKKWEQHYQAYLTMLDKKEIPRPKPIEPITPIPEIDIEADILRMKIWLASKQYLLHEESLEHVCGMFHVDQSDVEKIIVP